MTQVTVQRTINVAQERVWRVLADFAGIHRFHPFVARSPQVGELVTGLGTKRRCEFYDGNHVTEEIVGWDEGRSMDVSITDGTMPLHCAEAKFTVEPDGASRTIVKVSMNYEPKFGPVGWMMDKLMMKRNFVNLLGQVLEGLETHASTGALIGQGGEVIEQTQAMA